MFTTILINHPCENAQECKRQGNRVNGGAETERNRLLPL
jgi:hypothetical protein